MGRADECAKLLADGVDLAVLERAAHAAEEGGPRWVLEGGEWRRIVPAAPTPRRRSEPLIHMATVRGHVRVMEKLLAHIPNSLEQPNQNGDTPLAAAVKHGLEAPTKLLLALGARFDNMPSRGLKDSIAQLLHVRTMGPHNPHPHATPPSRRHPR